MQSIKSNVSRYLVSGTTIASSILFMACQPSDVNAQNTDGKYGLNSYNTPEVVDELNYIEKNSKTVSGASDTRVLITGSTAGVGQLTAKALIEKGYKVVLHARNEQRANDAKRDLPNAEAVVIGDLSDIEATKKLANDINALGTFDVIIHNAGVYQAQAQGNTIYHVNSLAPYILTSLVHKPKQLIYVSSDLHRGGDLKLQNMQSATPNINYNDSKLQVLALSKAVANHWKDVRVNAIRPGWVATKMGGSGSPDKLRLSYETLVWLVENQDPVTQTTGQFFFQKRLEPNYNKIVDDVAMQNALLAAYAKVTSIPFPK